MTTPAVQPEMIQWAIDRLYPDSANSEIFDPLSDDELTDLAESIQTDGVLNPITILPDGRIIAGEQRWRASKKAGLTLVPVRVYDVDESQAVRLRITENLRRRNVKTSETIRAVMKMVDLLREEGRRDGNPPPPPSEGLLNSITSKLMMETGLSQRSLQRYVKYQSLVDELRVLLDRRVIGTDHADYLYKLPEEQQQQLAEIFSAIASDQRLTKQEYQEQFEGLTNQVKSLNAKKSSLEGQIKSLLDSSSIVEEEEEAEETIDDPRIADLQAQLEEVEKNLQVLLSGKDEENKKLREDLQFRKYIETSDSINRNITGLHKDTAINPVIALERFAAHFGVEMSLQIQHDMIETIIPWLQSYHDEIENLMGSNSSVPSPQSNGHSEDRTVLQMPRTRV